VDRATPRRRAPGEAVNEVSCSVFDVFMGPLAQKGIALGSVVHGTTVPVAKLCDKKQRIDWAEFVAIMKNLRPHFTDDEYVQVGRSFMHSSALRFAFVVARLVFSPIDIYRWSNKPREGLGNQMFACVIPSYRELSANDIILELTLPDGYEVCWDFFVIVSGNNEELPRLFGLPPAKVKLSPIPRGGRMEIAVPTWRAPLLKRLWQLVTWPFTARAAARELKEAHETLIERFAQLEDARSKLDRQAAQLRTAHTLNELAQQNLDFGRTLETLTGALVSEAGFVWAEIKLADPASVTRAGAEDHDAPLVRELTGRAGQVIGEVAVVPGADADPAERVELLRLITPTLAIALENAIYKAGLERLVDQRTTELRQARDQLTGTIEQLFEAQGARERFFGNISHEIRTPLSLILLAAADIQARAGHALDARAQADLGSVADAARKLVRLVDELLLLAAGQEGKLRLHPEPTDLVALVDHLVAAWRPAAEAAGLELVARVPDSLVGQVDPVAIERVATNLVSNAVKYTPRGGRIELELADEPDGLRLSVLDTGPGIDDELVGRLFGRFERAAGDDHHKIGSGIGLSLVKQLVEGHGGTVAARARPSGGSELRVMLPAAAVLRGVARPILRSGVSPPPVAAGTIASGARLDPPAVSRGTILLAEDDAHLAEMIARLLADDYTVIVALDGEAALALVRKHQPQLLITDVDMPGINGIELSARFRELTGDKLAPIIILSAVLDLGTRVAGLEAGAVDYVTKPFEPIELRARVKAQFRTRELAVRLHRAEQLSTLGILTSGLAHELRNPANGIVNAIEPLTQLLPRELTRPDGGVGQLLEVMAGCAEQIGFLSRQLLSFRNGGMQLELRVAAVTELVRRAVALAHRALDGVEVRANLEGEGTLLCAPPLMIQVLTNLIENAGHAAGAGGWVAVDARSADGRTTIEVSDSGPGVPIELRDRVFEPFFTTKPPGTGSGLGLPLARAIVLRHGGILEIRERGTRPVFVVELAPAGAAL
jgi:signal transduction histidine kinase